MGYRAYSSTSRTAYTVNTSNKSQEEIFNDTLSPLMNPMNLSIRECRDSDNHPETYPIIIGLDVTGSMGYIPEYIVKEGLTHIVEGLMKAGIKSPAIMFVAIGDEYYDRYPLQVGQFESDDMGLAKWLEHTHLEGRGGGGNHESYGLTWLVGGEHVALDSVEKRNQRGVLITIGDERNWDKSNNLTTITGNQNEYTDKELLELARKNFHVMHIHANDASYRTSDVKHYWKGLLGQNFVVADNHKDIPKVIVENIMAVYDSDMGNTDDVQSSPETTDTDVSGDTIKSEPEVL